MDQKTKRKLILAAAFLYLPLLFFSLYKLHLEALLANRYTQKGEMYLGTSDFARVFPEYERALEIDSSTVNPYARFRFGWAAYSYGKLERYKGRVPQKFVLKRALETLEENMEKEWPLFTRNYILAGRVSADLFRAGQAGYKEKAEGYFEKALELSPKRPSIYLDLSRLDVAAGDLEEAEEDIEKALAINRLNENAVFEFTLLKIRQRKFEEVEQRLAEHDYPFSFDRMNEAALAWEEAGEEEEALRYYKKLAAQWPMPFYVQKVKELRQAVEN